MSEEIAGIGYINDERRHVLISIREPSIQSRWLNSPNQEVVQVGITIETAIELRAGLNAFLEAHGVAEN